VLKFENNKKKLIKPHENKGREVITDEQVSNDKKNKIKEIPS